MIHLKRIQARIALLERDVVATEALVNKVSTLPMDEARVKRLASLEALLESRRRHLKKAKQDLQYKEPSKGTKSPIYKTKNQCPEYHE